MIVETIVTTIAADGTLNFAPMGVEWGDETIVLKPFLETTTYRNIAASRAAVVNLTDDVRIFARAAISSPQYRIRSRRPSFAASCSPTAARGASSKCGRSTARRRARVSRWRSCTAGRAASSSASIARRHAVLEAAIYATRLHLLPRAFIDSEMARLQVIVDKTAGPQELEAMALLTEHIRATPTAPGTGAAPERA